MKINIISEIINIIDLEINEISKLKQSIDKNCENAVMELFNCKGKVILTGIGKSGIIARKVAATLASTGTPAIFVHPAEGMHGDLGMIEGEDLVIAISKSGQSSELNSILPVIKKIGAKVIAITGNSRSDLARMAEHVLNISDLKEACPFNIAPTTSTTATLILGDAIAVTLMKMRKFNIEQFALIHPGGRLGKRLTMQVSDIMLSGECNPVVSIRAGIKEVLLTISEKKAGAVSVVDNDGKLHGLITDYDIRKHLQREENIFCLPIRDIINPNPIFIYEDEKAYATLEIMQKREKPISVLPVLNRDDVVVGMLRLQDLIKEGL